MAPRRLRVFLSHALDDEPLVRRLARQLSQVLDESLVDLTGPERFRPRPGRDWPREREEALDGAQVIVLLVTEGYLRDDHTYRELLRASERHAAGQAIAVAIVVEPAELPKHIASEVETVPRDGRPLDDLSPHTISEVAIGLAEVIERVAGEEFLPVEEPVKLSPSVQQAIRGMNSAPVTTAAIVEAILKLHGEYGDGLAKHTTVQEGSDPVRRPAPEWLDQVRTLYDRDAVPELHGRAVVRGLALLDADLTKGLLAHGFLSELEGELKPPLLESLSTEGYRLWEPGEVPTWGDRPAREDQLHRTQFAHELAEMIDDERQRSIDEVGKPEAFLVHLHGPWGSGKTSLLGFLGVALESRKARWVVVPFNAWQQERLEAPWWSLMTAVHRAGKRLAFVESGQPKRPWNRQRLRDLWRSVRLVWLDLVWRIRLGWMAYLLLPLVVGALWLGWENDFFETATTDDGWLTQAGNIAKPVAAIVGLGAALFGAVRGLSRSLSVGSARGAETFMKNTKDPMRTLTKRFERVVRTVGRPIAVFVDDLDRCQSSYVVEVLQGIQTLLIDAPVTYVVAADRRWLYDSYAKVYADFESVSREPGRPLGHLFLEKTFQLSAALPQLDPTARSDYWRVLVVPRARRQRADEGRMREEASKRVESAGLSQALREIDAGRARSPDEDRALREAVARRLTDTDVEEEIKYRLMPFSRLLEPNPRAMKRLINAYRIELRRMLAEGRQVGSAAVTPEQLALWTILSMRWPLLADRLALHSGVLDSTGDESEMGDLLELWKSEPVQEVVSGHGVAAQLTESAVRAVVGLDRKKRLAQAPEGGPAGGQGAVA